MRLGAMATDRENKPPFAAFRQEERIAGTAASRPEVVRQVFSIGSPSCLSRGDPRRLNASRYFDSS
jgi:hypothetical protein